MENKKLKAERNKRWIEKKNKECLDLYGMSYGRWLRAKHKKANSDVYKKGLARQKTSWEKMSEETRIKVRARERARLAKMKMDDPDKYKKQIDRARKWVIDNKEKHKAGYRTPEHREKVKAYRLENLERFRERDRRSYYKRNYGENWEVKMLSNKLFKEIENGKKKH